MKKFKKNLLTFPDTSHSFIIAVGHILKSEVVVQLMPLDMN